MRSASNPHAFMGVTEQGLAAIVKTRGNQDVHVILRGGTKGTNYDEESVKKVAQQMEKTRPGSWASIMIDCSRTSLSVLFRFIIIRYFILFLGLTFVLPPQPLFQTDGNSQKNHLNQPKVVSTLCEQLRAGDRNITGVMIESHINGGRQDVPPEGPQGLKHGVSITDACVDWEMTVAMLDELNEVSR